MAVSASAVVLAASVGIVGLTGCDQGHQDDQSTIGGPPVFLTAANVSATQTLPVNGRIELAFDRYLDPLTITRQAFVLTDGFGAVVSTAVLDYDPVVQKVSLEAPAGVDPWLVVNQNYTLTLVVAPNGVSGGGVRSIDGAALSQQTVIGFRTSAASTSVITDPTVDFCGDVLPVFQRSCSANNCHGAEAINGDPTRTGSGPSFPAEGLILSDANGVTNTAIGRVANEANTGAKAGTPNAYIDLFGADYAIIDQGHPEQSWLLYKCLLSVPGDGVTPPATGTDCTGKTITPTAITYTTASSPATAAERARLDTTIEGNPMPYPYFAADGSVSAAGTSALTVDELERLRLWIKQGAAVTDCNAACTKTQ